MFYRWFLTVQKKASEADDGSPVVVNVFSSVNVFQVHGVREGYVFKEEHLLIKTNNFLN